MSRLSYDQTLKLLRIAVRFLTPAAAALSPFEGDLCRDVLMRYRNHGGDAPVTSAEWAVLEDSLDAMSAHPFERMAA